LIYSVSYFNLGGLVLFGRAKPWRRDWLGDLVPIFVPPGKISLRRPGYGCCMAQQNCIRVFAWNRSHDHFRSSTNSPCSSTGARTLDYRLTGKRVSW